MNMNAKFIENRSVGAKVIILIRTVSMGKLSGSIYENMNNFNEIHMGESSRFFHI